MMAPDTAFLVNFFDLVRFQNAALDFDLSIISYEMKDANLLFQFGVGANLFRSGVRSVRTKAGRDEVLDYNFLVASTPKWYGRFKYQPDLRFGADLQIEQKYFRPLLLNEESKLLFVDNDPVDEFGAQDFSLEESDSEVTGAYYSFHLNLYGQLGKKSGVFASFLAELDGLGKGTQIFPRLLIGYSTNIANYVNSLPDKK